MRVHRRHVIMQIITVCLVEWMAPTRSERTFFSSVWMENGGGWSRSEMEYSQHMRVGPVRQNLADEFGLRGFRPSRDGRRLLPRVRATSTPRTTTSTAGAAQGEAASSTSAAAARSIVAGQGAGSPAAARERERRPGSTRSSTSHGRSAASSRARRASARTNGATGEWPR